MGRSFPYKPVYLIDVMVHGRVEACLPANDPSHWEAALAKAPEPFGVGALSPWR